MRPFDIDDDRTGDDSAWGAEVVDLDVQPIDHAGAGAAVVVVAAAAAGGTVDASSFVDSST